MRALADAQHQEKGTSTSMYYWHLKNNRTLHVPTTSSIIRVQVVCNLGPGILESQCGRNVSLQVALSADLVGMDSVGIRGQSGRETPEQPGMQRLEMEWPVSSGKRKAQKRLDQTARNLIFSLFAKHVQIRRR